MLARAADAAEKPLPAFAEIPVWSVGMAHLSAISSAPLNAFAGEGKPSKASKGLDVGGVVIVNFSGNITGVVERCVKEAVSDER